MFNKRKLSKKQQRFIDNIKRKETSLKSLKSSKNFLEKQLDELNNISQLTSEEKVMERNFINDKLNSVQKRIELCEKEVQSLKSEYEIERKRRITWL